MNFKKSKMVAFALEIYGGSIVFVNNIPYDSMVKALKEDGEFFTKEFVEHIESNKSTIEPVTNGAITVTNGFESLIILGKQTDYLNFHNSLSHEVFHTVHATLKRKGFKLTNASEEAYAYLTGWITEKILM